MVGQSNGAQQALSLLADVFLQPSDTILCIENPPVLYMGSFSKRCFPHCASAI